VAKTNSVILSNLTRLSHSNEHDIPKTTTNIYRAQCGDNWRKRERKVLSWISENFEHRSVTVEDFPLFPAGKRVIDGKGDELVAYFDLITDSVNYEFPAYGGCNHDSGKSAKNPNSGGW
jgi:hypothetical protein